MLTHSEQLDQIAPALAAFQGEVDNAGKTAQNAHLKNKYADLAEIVNTISPVLAKHGLSYSQHTSSDPANGTVTVEGFLLHKSGQWLKSSLTLPCAKWDAQGIGSAITYGRRYQAAAMAFIGQEDDDGEGAVGRGTRPGQQARPQAQTPAPTQTSAPTQSEAAKNYANLRQQAVTKLKEEGLPEADAVEFIKERESELKKSLGANPSSELVASTLTAGLTRIVNGEK